MQIKRSGSQPSTKAPADWFTGTVRIDPLFPITPPARAAGNAVTFEPGAPKASEMWILANGVRALVGVRKSP